MLDSVVAMFEEDASAIVDSLQSPQTSLRDKAKKVSTESLWSMVELYFSGGILNWLGFLFIEKINHMGLRRAA